MLTFNNCVHVSTFIVYLHTILQAAITEQVHIAVKL
jgi:hypothetical protein